MKLIYQKTQYGILAIFFVFILFFITFAFYYQIGDEPLPLTTYIFLMSIFLIIILLFYKLEIRIDKEKIYTFNLSKNIK